MHSHSVNLTLVHTKTRVSRAHAPIIVLVARDQFGLGQRSLNVGLGTAQLHLQRREPQLRERHIDEGVEFFEPKAVAHRALEAAQTRRLPREEAINIGALELVKLGHVAKVDLCECVSHASEAAAVSGSGMKNRGENRGAKTKR